MSEKALKKISIQTIKNGILRCERYGIENHICFIYQELETALRNDWKTIAVIAKKAIIELIGERDGSLIYLHYKTKVSLDKIDDKLFEIFKDVNTKEELSLMPHTVEKMLIADKIREKEKSSEKS